MPKAIASDKPVSTDSNAQPAASRRQALLDGGKLLGAVGLASACGGSDMTSSAACMATPSGTVVPGADKLAVSSAMSIAVGGTTFFVARDAGGFMALSAICTHNGCTVGFTAASATFDCPCHGSQYNLDGTVNLGPAKQALAHVLLCKNSSGQLVMDTSMSVPTSDRLK